MKEKLIVKNFGAIKSAEIEVKDINIFIGHTASGKSTLAKLIAIFKNIDFVQSGGSVVFKKMLEDYNIDFEFKKNTLIRYESENFYWEVKKDEISTNYFFTPSPTFFEPIYIPAERILIAMVGESLFGLMSKDIALAKSFKDFGAKFETARKKIKSFDVNFLKVKYLHEQGSNFLVLENKIKIKLENAASGLQSIVPLLLVVTHATEQDSIIRNCIVVEEPELNLYPSIQKELIEFLIEKTQKVGDKLIITTHSPYVLTTIDNLIQANNVVQLHKEQRKEVNHIIPSKLWVDFDKVSCYFVANGTAQKTLNEEFRTIGASNIDDVSIELGKTFDELMDLKYQEYAS